MRVWKLIFFIYNGGKIAFLYRTLVSYADRSVFDTTIRRVFFYVCSDKIVRRFCLFIIRVFIVTSLEWTSGRLAVRVQVSRFDTFANTVPDNVSGRDSRFLFVVNIRSFSVKGLWQYPYIYLDRTFNVPVRNRIIPVQSLSYDRIWVKFVYSNISVVQTFFFHINAQNRNCRWNHHCTRFYVQCTILNSLGKY